MEFKLRAMEEKASTYLSPASSIGSLTDQALLTGFSNSDNQKTDLSLNPMDVREAIQREIEKELIREEIIAAEITRRRILEAEVRREMLIERELTLRKEGLSMLSPSVSGSSALRLESRLPGLNQLESKFPTLNHSEGKSIEERLAFLLHQSEGKPIEERLPFLLRREFGGFQEDMPFQRHPEAAAAEMKPISEANKEKIIFLAKPMNSTLSGAKRKASSLASVPVTQSTIDSKKPKEDWSCALCQVSASSERTLNEHLQGKKHKFKEDGMRSYRKIKLSGGGVVPNEVLENLEKKEGEEVVVSKEEKLKKEDSIPVKKPEDSPTRNKMEDLKEKKSNWPTKTRFKKCRRDRYKPVEKKPRTEDWKKKFDYWCEMCQVGAHAEKVMNSHRDGKRHAARVEELKLEAIEKAKDAEPQLPPPVVIGTETKDNQPSATVTEDTEKASVEDTPVIEKDVMKEKIEEENGFNGVGDVSGVKEDSPVIEKGEKEEMEEGNGAGDVGGVNDEDPKGGGDGVSEL